jgi:hypothetical protein
MNLSHEERTATEPRDKNLHSVIIDEVTPVNNRIKIYRLAVKDREKGINVHRPLQTLMTAVAG